jgi:acyl-coenzyme A synthetase/AMP-(fatty) acid ligase
MPQSDRSSLWHALTQAENLPRRFLAGIRQTIPLGELAGLSCMEDLSVDLSSRSVLLYSTDQLTAALALIELDGAARRIVLCPPDIAPEHLPYVAKTAGIDAIVTDRPIPELRRSGIPCWHCSSKLTPSTADRAPRIATEWILLTSGTTGRPKLVVHTLASLAGAISPSNASTDVVWSTFYDIRRYGGLQILLRALLTGASIVFSSAAESPSDFLGRAGALGVTHISGTPSHWRRALMSGAANKIDPQYVRLSGEIADQALLNNLQSAYPRARIAHAFATTEAGLAFEVNDGAAGFPASQLTAAGDVELRIQDGSLGIRSSRIASRYLGPGAEPLAAPDGFVDTRDMIELRGDRYYFTGRRDGVINIGGQKVHPEEVEAVINRHPRVRMSLVRTRKSPITGSIVAADVVLAAGIDSSNGNAGELRDSILLLCRQELAPHKVPASIRFVPDLAINDSGKLTRSA